MSTAPLLSERDRLVTAEEIIRDLSVSRRSFEMMLRDHRLPREAGRIGGVRRWILRDYLAARARLLAGPAGVQACAMCGSDFPKGRDGSIYCSARCRTKAWRARRVMSAPASAEAT